MRARVYSNGGNSTGGFTFNGGSLTGPLNLSGNPSDPLEAAPKQYLDSTLVNLTAGNITSGILPSGRLPTFTGDLVKPAGSSTINLAPTGIVAGDYIKPTVDSKGRVVSGGVLVDADIPNLSWTKIVSDHPTTLAGYGINDAMSLSGGTLSGFLSFNGSVTGNLQAVTKQYIDVTLSVATGIAIGDIIRKPYSTTPPGFLKCNGGEVSKTTYNSLYATIGDRFSKKHMFTSGRPWEQQHTINEVQSGDISSWTYGTPAPFSLSGANRIFVTKNRVYHVGGWNTTTVCSSAVYTAPINADGTLGTWVVDASFPIPVLNPNMFVVKNKVYVLGGFTGLGGGGTDTVNYVYMANIKANGTIGAWTYVGPMPGATYCASLIATNTRVYIISGSNSNNTGDATNKVYSAPIGSDGLLGAWVTEANFPTTRCNSSAFVIKTRAYLVGGYVSLYSSSDVRTIYSAIINTDGTLGTWSIVGNLPYPLVTSSFYITKQRVYLLGGKTNDVITGATLSAPINADGTLGAWTTGTNLLYPGHGLAPFAAKNKLYLVSGYSAAGNINTVMVGDISGGLNDYSTYYSEDITNYVASGSGRPWEQQYQTNTAQSTELSAWTATTSLPSDLGLTTAIVTKNRVYVLGGYRGATLTYNGTVYTAPINTDGTLGTWTTGTALPVVMGWTTSVVTKNRVYLFGGWNVSLANSVYSAPINADGTLGTWIVGTPLPATGTGLSSFVTKNRVYVLGGMSSDGQTTNLNVYTATFDSNGVIGTWSSPKTIPEALINTQIAVTKNRVYLIGSGFVTGVNKSKVWSADINSDGLIGIWRAEPSLPIAIGGASIYVTSTRAYLIGGYNGSAYLNTVYSAGISPEGEIGLWTIGSNIPVTMYYMGFVATKNHLYLLGGLNNATSTFNNVYTTSILGSENDYSPYYDGTVQPATLTDNTTTFALPDLTKIEKFDTISYIKY